MMRYNKILGILFTVILILGITPVFADVHEADEPETEEIIETKQDLKKDKEVIIDLDLITARPVNDNGYVVDTTDNTIFVQALDFHAVRIKGDGTNGGGGWSIGIHNATYITIENNTFIYGSAGHSGLAIISEEDVTIFGGGLEIFISSIDGEAINSNAPKLTFEGEFGDITGGVKPDVKFGAFGIIAREIVIAGTIGLISGGNGDFFDGTAIFTFDGNTFVSGSATIFGAINSNLTLTGGTIHILPFILLK